VLVYQDDGELVLYDNARGRRLWAAGTVGTRVGECVLQRDGNLVIYESLGRPIWASGTSGLPVDRLVVRDEGDVVLVDACGEPLWSTDPAPRGGLRPGSWAHGSQLGLEQTLRRQSLSSPSGAFVLAHQDDGDLVLYRSIDGRREWSAGTDGTVTGECVLERDGNLVIYEATGRPVWASGTADTAVERLVVRDDGSTVLLDDAGSVLWSSLSSPRTG